MYFLFFFIYISLLYTSLVTILLHTLYFISYMMMMYVFLHLSLYVLFLFYHLYTCFLMNAIFISVSHMMPWWVLFKCFRKIDCEILPCHELSSYKVFQEFMLGLDLFCKTTSGYEFTDLRLLSWFICLL